jgi:hypothetical protein
MFCVIYRFRVRPGEGDRFVRAWSHVTTAFIDSCGALGSRLHQATENEYIAYAQWPSSQVRDEARLPAEISEGPYEEMRGCCESIETLHELVTVADHLVLVRAATSELPPSR